MIDSNAVKKANLIANKARKSISKFCYEECKSYCCRKGYLVLTEKEIKLVTHGRQKELEKTPILKKLDNGKYSLFFGGKDEPCPALKNFKCTIHKSKNRSSTCKNFPLFVEGKYIRLSPRCLAVKQDKLYPFVRQLIKLGYKQQEAESNADILYDVAFEKK
ncbi:YkgJ family cysteine cluster protein [Candidatus Woesearchaeota archaeon]|nr:YkgJ family cysteine cluster protein [Candidatus Woesearchaeota archaeon]